MLRVSAVVVRWRGGAEVHRCLASLVSHGGPHLAEVTLVDSGSGDRGAYRLAAHFPEVRLVRLARNEGFASAVNAGWESGQRHDAILLVNPDCVVPPGAVTSLTRFVASHPECAGAVPLLVGADGRSQHRWQLRHLPSAVRLALGSAGAPWSEHRPRSAAPVPQPAAACWLVRREAWDDLGGFDTRFRRAWWEDVDFCRRLGDSGHGRLWVVPEAEVRHIGGSSVNELRREEFLSIYFGNLAEYVRRHHSRNDFWLRPLLAMSLMMRGALRPRRWTAYRSAAAAVIRRPDGSGLR